MGLNVVLVGAGRMGLRHLDGLAALEGDLHVVDPRPEVEADVLARFGDRPRQRLFLHSRLEDVPLDDVTAAILGETASGRLERLERLAHAGVRHVLAEKPLEQSRARVGRMRELARQAGLAVRVNHYLRTVGSIRELRDEGGPYRMVLAGGAYGLACNGVHQLDLACFLADAAGRVVYAELEPTPIASGRGPQFRDYGGLALVRFDDGSSLYLDCSATSSAPVVFAIVQPGRLSYSDGSAGVVHRRDPASSQPVFRYGADYGRSEGEPFDRVALATTTAAWLRSLTGDGESHLPTLEEARPGHDLLFDLLETTGELEFAIT